MRYLGCLARGLLFLLVLGLGAILVATFFPVLLGIALLGIVLGALAG